MTLDKAIELSKEAESSLRKHKFIDHADAVKLLTEAAKHFRDLREVIRVPFTDHLPGEDPE
ncbi:hypothetical protein ES703_41409 [subsurface metagenome]